MPGAPIIRASGLILNVLAKIAKMISGRLKQMSRARRRSPGALHQRRPEPMEAVAISATVAKNEFGRILERVIQGGKFVITKHASAKAVLISVREFNALSNAHLAELETLND